MTPKLPAISGDELIRALGKFGYVEIRQTGSHVRMRHPTDAKRRPLSVPRHKTLKRGLLRRILRDAQIAVDELTSAL
jgi:predicted RNA binding protein YcfA (HicA-like mRNA interferase family)